MQKKLITLFFSFLLVVVFFQPIDAVSQDVQANPQIKKLVGRRSLSVKGYVIDTRLIRGIYKNFGNKYIWHGEDDAFNDDGRKAIEFLSKAEENGLDQADYSIKKINGLIKSPNSKKIPRTDILITQMFVNLVSDIANGGKIEKEWEIEHFLKRRPRVTNYVEALNAFLNIPEVNGFIDEYSPPHEQYGRLRELLSEILQERDTVSRKKNIPTGRSINPGMVDYRVPMIREALGSEINSINPNTEQVKKIYDKNLQKEILNLQKKFGLKTDGIIGNQTISAMNTGPKQLVRIIKANMERYRWFSEEFKENRVVVNVPEFRLRAYEDGEEKLSLSTVVGKRKKKTPLIATKMTDVIFHPYWYVPQGYAGKQILPQIKKNPRNYLIDEEYTVIDNSNGGWKTVDPATVNWSEMNADNFKYVLRQDPGAKNALGPIKFNILNHLSIYLHGTTKPWLFEKRVRSFSSGCVRIDGPQKLAYMVLKHNADYDQEKIDKLLNAYDNDYDIPYYKKPIHKKIILEKQMATYLTYFTIHVDEDGNYNLFDDIYGWDKLL